MERRDQAVNEVHVSLWRQSWKIPSVFLLANVIDMTGFALVGYNIDLSQLQRL